ncbi:unnamed protein product [Rotaria sordida]|uniref:1-phosphatidylinositol 4,5-bisphosphate phosphodiesterase n=1 Tax=Rotaria sordida TaxID=392033 RepID=A0A813SZQ0_9BILA|nr:unnamed protein product [Rotaria sordida]
MAARSYSVPSLKLNEIPDHLKIGTFALKWPEEIKKSPTPIMVNLSIDAKGFYLICLNKAKKENECFDLALIHDTRTGSQVSLPSGHEYFQKNNIGVLDVPIASKWLTIYYGNTFVASDMRLIHFYFESPSIAEEWAERLFQFGHNQILRHLSSLGCLEKLHSRIINSLIDVNRKTISVRSLIQFLCKNTRDSNKEKTILRALNYLKLPCQVDSTINLDEFTFNNFFRLYMRLMECHEIDKLFESLDRKRQRYLSWENMKVFIQKQNAALNDTYTMDLYEQKAKDLIKKYTEYDGNFKEKGMSNELFLRYLLSFDNLIIDPKKLDLCMDMNKPLAHYFISSSHNTYLTGSQWTGRSSVEMYRQVLLTGCRCIELDVVDSERKNDEPEIKHKNTPVRPVLFIEVIVAIKEYAFKVTPYPLILSIENHCGPKAQAKMAQYFVDVFGEYLITEPLKTHPCEEHYPLPSPNDLKYKILIKNKKLNPNLTSKLNNENNRLLPRKQTTTSTTSSSDQSIDMSTVSSSSKNLCHTTLSDESTKSKETLFEQMSPLENHQQLVNKNPRYCVLIDDGNSSDDGTDINEINSNEYQSSTNDRYRESKATKAMSDLVHYIVPVRFKTFALAEERNRSYEISSFSEEKAYNLIREQAKEFLAYNQRQLCRIYPRGTRLDSSNYNPYIYWPIGCQMCALNYQTLDAAMQLNLGLFSFNNGCGYIEKPSALCQSKSSFDPRIRMNVENVAGYQIYIKVISGQFLCQDREPTFVDIQMYGMYGDANKRNEFLVRAKRWNGFQAIYDDIDIDSNKYSIRFPNVTLPEMAALRFVVSTEDGTLLGQSFIPIAHIRPGYRYVVLRNQMNIPIHSSSLLIFIQINVHIKAEDQDFANKLVEPLKDQTKDLNKSNQDSNNEKNQYNDIFSKMLIRNHSSFPIQQENTSAKRSETTTSSDETNWYQKHLIAASRLHDRKTLCKVLSFNDIISKEVVKRDESIPSKLRRISIDYQKKIEEKEDHFQKCLNLQYDETYVHSDNSNMANNSENKCQITSDSHKQNIEQSLLTLYSKKFTQQEELECESLNEYYDKIEKYIRNDYRRQINQIDNILQEEKSRVNEYVQSQIKRETNDIEKTEKDRNQITMLKQKSSQSNSKAGTLTSRTLEEMHEDVKEQLQINLQTNLDELEKQKAKEIQKCLEKYFNQLDEIKSHLEQLVNNNEDNLRYDNSPSPSSSSSSSHASKMRINASLAAISPYTVKTSRINSEPI